MCFVVRFLRFAIRFADAITEHLLEHGDALPQQLGVLWTFEGSRFRCIEKVEEAQGNTMLTKRLDLWSLWFPFVFLMSLPFITISTYIYFFYLFHSSMFFPFPFLPDRSWSTWPRRTADGLVRHFGSLVTSMNTLFKSISGGVTWEDPAEVLFEVGAEWVAVFTFYIAFCCY